MDVVGGGPAGLLLATGTSLDVLEMPAAVGRLVCAQLRAAGVAVPVAATPTGRWWFPVTTGGTLPAPLRESTDVVLHTGGAAVLAPPSETPDGWVHWRVAPAPLRLPSVTSSIRSSRQCSLLPTCTRATASP